jgi:hypothetical protein
VQQAPAISRSSAGRTLGVAAWILGAAFLVEIICASVALVDRARHNPPLSIKIPPQDEFAGNSQAPVATHPQPAFNDPFASITNSTPAPAATSQPAPAQSTPAEMASLPNPTPVPEDQITTPQSRLDGLVAEGIALRARGDTSTAVTRLREALAMSPKNPLVISELAETYEKMDLTDKALEQWRTIYDMGEAAGIYYTAADAKLKAAQLGDGDDTASSQDTTASTGDGDDSGFQPGSQLALVNLSTVEKPPTPDGYDRFTLKIPVKRRPNIKIDVSGVVIQVFFYDQLGDQSVVRTNASVSSHWNSLPADWQSDDIEILDVDYTQSPPEPGAIEASRHYYGYIVCVYYNKALQDQAADPPGLIKTYPPPLTLPEPDK